jgi:hypothetical protein
MLHSKIVKRLSLFCHFPEFSRNSVITANDTQRENQGLTPIFRSLTAIGLWASAILLPTVTLNSIIIHLRIRCVK